MYSPGNAAPVLQTQGPGVISYIPYPVPAVGQAVQTHSAPQLTGIVAPSGGVPASGTPMPLGGLGASGVPVSPYHFATWGQRLPAPPQSVVNLGGQ